ncbi:MAG: ankyrin repeat domain-containing protein [Legionella sp.]|nr:ankyrin repeat domain-containing protein [Legionella sp.]
MSITATLFALINESITDEAHKNKNLEQIKLLLSHNEDYKKAGLKDLEINFSTMEVFKESGHNDEYLSLLTAAISKNKIEVVKLLIQHGMSPNEDISTIPPLSFAAKINSKEIVEFLLASGADVNKFDSKYFNKNPLFVACKADAFDAIQILLLNNCDTNLKGDDKKTAIQYIPKSSEKTLKLMEAGIFLKKAIDILANSAEIFAANSALNSALENNANFVLHYMVKMIEATNSRVQGNAYNEAYYHPKILRLAIKNLKTFANTFPDFIVNHFPEGIKDFLDVLKKYEIEKTKNILAPSELLFKDSKEKTKTIRLFEDGAKFLGTKPQISDNKSSLTQSIVNLGSPIYRYPEIKSEPASKDLNKNFS